MDKPSASRKNVYMPGPILDRLADRGGLSGAIVTIVDRYFEMIRRTRIERRFSEAEINLMRDACISWLPEPAAAVFGGVALEVEDGLADGLAEKWGVDAEALLTKLKALTPGEEVALVELVAPPRE